MPHGMFPLAVPSGHQDSFKMRHIIVEVFRFTSGYLHEISCHFIEVQSIIRVLL